MENEFTIGQIFSRSFDTFSRNFPFMLAMAFLAVLPLTLVQLFPGQTAVVLAGYAGYWLNFLILQGVITYGVYQGMTGSRPSLSESLAVALRRLVPMVLVSLAVLLLSAIGMVFLIVPGIIIQMMLWVAVPVTIVEKGGVGHALQRSKDLTVGYRGRIFALTLLLGVIGALAGGVGGFVNSMLISTHSLTYGSVRYVLAYLPIQVIFQGLISALNAVVVTVGYYSLRQEVEGVAIGDLAEVFD